jgi:hypothetical protein
MSSNAEATVRINHAGRAEMHAAIAAAVTEVAAQDIWPEAVRASRVKTGHNRRSIGVEVKAFGETTFEGSGNGELTAGVAQTAPDGVSFAIYTQSGYGGWLETGTRYMTGIPYIYPAVQKYLGGIAAAIRRRLET